MEAFAKETIGNSPASIKTTLNEAAIIAARRNNGIINREILDEAWMKQLMEGHLKKNADKDNIELVAWHEAGHALAVPLMGTGFNKGFNHSVNFRSRWSYIYHPEEAWPVYR